MKKHIKTFGIIALSSAVLIILLRGVEATANLLLTMQEFDLTFHTPLAICVLWTGIIGFISVGIFTILIIILVLKEVFYLNN